MIIYRRENIYFEGLELKDAVTASEQGQVKKKVFI